MKKFTVLIVSCTVLFIAVSFLSTIITTKLNLYKQKKEQIANELNFENRLLNAWEWVPGNSIGEEKVALWQDLENKAKAHYNGTIIYALILGGIVFAFVGINFFVYKDKSHVFQAKGITIVFASLSFLYLGLQSPLLELHAYNKDLAFEIPIDISLKEIDFIGGFFSDLGVEDFKYDFSQTFEGRTYYLYQNKSIFQLIGLLYTGGNYLVSIILILFSVVFPLIKLIASIFVLANPLKPTSKKTYATIKNLGKWSMADVFVAAIFLAIFSFSTMNVGIDTGSTTLIGTYFYLLFVVLSISSGTYLKKAMARADENASVAIQAEEKAV